MEKSEATYYLMERLLSSKMTFFYKKIFPAAWIITFSFITFLVWFGSCQAASATKWLTIVCLTAGSLFILWYSSRLKTIRLQGDHLVVSDYRSEEVIPLLQIGKVEETRIWNPKLIKLRLVRPGQWGDDIVFIAPVQCQFIFSNHPLVRELRDMITEKRRGSE
jgi:hypothetical protein